MDTNVSDIKELWNQYENSVIDLAKKLPQWNSEDKTRVYHSAISSMFEEAGELAGLCSKMRSRSKEYGKPVKEQANFEQAKQKFIDETSDLLWVITCSSWCLNTQIDVYKVLSEIMDLNTDLDFSNNSNYGYCDFELFLYDIFAAISSFSVESDSKFSFCNILDTFGYFLSALKFEYDIDFSTLLQFNMDKLNMRYDKDGKRVDGK